MIPHSRPTLDETDIAAVVEVLRSGQIAQGPRVAAFEQALAEYVGMAGAVAVNSGTSALHLALLALGVEAGDEVVLPSFVCCALLNAVSYVGAVPVLADVGRDLNIAAEDVKRRLTPRAKAVILPHLFGTPVDPRPFRELGLLVVEDCAQAIGAELDGRKCGSLGDVAVFSFYATKMMATGEGGMVASDSTEVLARVRDLRDYDKRPDYRLRYNYKMTDLAAALGISQLRRLDGFVSKRREIAAYYTARLSGANCSPPERPAGASPAYYRYVTLVDGDASRIISRLETEGIAAAQPVPQPLHVWTGQTGFPAADEALRRAVSLPIFPGLTPGEVEHVALSTSQALQELCP